MKKLKFILSAILLGTLTTGCSNSKTTESELYQMLKSSRDSLYCYKKYYNKAQENLHKYEAYMKATETLLDSLGVGEDAPILETDAGSDYLSTAREVKLIQDPNYFNVK